jgi:hypothetical protein
LENGIFLGSIDMDEIVKGDGNKNNEKNEIISKCTI